MTLCAVCVAVVMYFAWLQPGSAIAVALIVISWQVALVLPARQATIWIVVQSIAHLWLNSSFSPNDFMNTLSHFTIFALDSFTAVIVMMAKKEVHLRTEQALVNAQLQATRELLAESSRSNERLRISRELHDALGHRLTALYLHQEIAINRCKDEDIRSLIKKTQDVSQGLLADVRSVVRQLRETSGVNLAGALEALTAALPDLKIHLHAPSNLTVDDPEQANVLIRCVQEIITNTIKHSTASQVWIDLRLDGDKVQVHAHDDGTTLESVPEFGLGLRGMRERFREFGGDVEVSSGEHPGLSVRALMPLRSN
ncbi:sensor histidine kinase [Terriglobus tenax]|uniref:sensor histidine kinase n=1 Tax=Terriglobus tenax TaxID=1111115 RepID=UPI0021E0EE05|nr:sensor histidine kinase [Terriglobus tenax]